MNRLTVSVLPPFCWEDNLRSQKGGIRKKRRAWGVLMSPCHRYLPGGGGLSTFLGKKDFVKWNMVLRAQFSNASIGLFNPNNQLFSFVTF